MPQEVAKGILQRERRPDGQAEKILYRVGPPDMWRAESGMSLAEAMARAGVSLIQADRERVAGWQRMYAMLDGTDQQTRLRVPDALRNRQLRALAAHRSDRGGERGRPG